MTDPDIQQVADQFAAGSAVGSQENLNGVRWQWYASGAVVVASSHGVRIVYGEIARAYRTFDGPAGPLGVPRTSEEATGDGVGRYNEFDHGSIYWSPITGAHEVHGDIRVRWLAGAGHAGELGYPITDELSYPPFAYQFFQYGALKWTAQHGVVSGCPRDRLFGIADTHAHPAAHLGFGGGLVSGLVEGPATVALADCSRNHGAGGTGFLRPDVHDIGGAAAGIAAAYLVAPLAAPIVAAVPDTIQGITLAELEGSFGHWTWGYPDFDGWPRHNSRVHQQMYLEWVERAYRHGVRLMVALANHSNFLASVAGDDRAQRDMDAGLRQLDYLNDLVSRIPWMGVAHDPDEARDLIADNKMAVVLGVELDTLGGLEQPAADWTVGARPVSNAELDALVQLLWDRNVRYVFPIHLTDNAFGGTALYRDEFIESSAIEGRPVTSANTRDLAFGKRNVHGLSDAGARLLKRLMDRGALIDIDHMSWRATRDAIELTRVGEAGYPLVSGHATFHDLAVQGASSDHGGSDESRKEEWVVRELARRGSFVGVQPVAQPLAAHTEADAGLNADCPGSSSQFARAFQYAVDKAAGRVTMGTDLNGFATTCGPRFGPNAVSALVDEDSRRLVEEAQHGGVRYTEALKHPVARRLEHPRHMWTPRRREVLYCIHLAEAGKRPSIDLNPFDLDFHGVVDGLTASSEPSAGHARAAFRARHGHDPGDLRGPDRELYDDLKWVLQRHRAAGNGGNPPLKRCVTAGHDWDYNLEGLAHYGLIPDLLADLGNLGLPWDTKLMPLLTSAETVVTTWERCGDPAAHSQRFITRDKDRKTLSPPARYKKPRVAIPTVTRRSPLG